MAVFGPYPATVLSIHDGDTMTVAMTLKADMGFGFKMTGEVTLACRCYGINAPELATPEGKAALAYALTLIKPGDTCQVVSHGWDKYGGRFDGAISLADGRDFGVAMVTAGFAKPYFGTGPKT